MKRTALALALFANAGILLSQTPPVGGAALPADVYPGLRTPNGDLLPSVAGHLGQDVTIRDRSLDPELLKRRKNFGYAEDEITKRFSVPVRMVLDNTGLDRSLIKPPPAPGVHPRVLFNPEDLAGIRERLEKTEAGRSAMEAIRKNNLSCITGPGAKFADQYQDLIEGRVPEKLDVNVAYCLMYEAFRCLIDDDAAGGQKVAAAITTLAGLAITEIAANRADPRNAASLNDARVISQGPTREFTLGLAYDFAYQFMTPDQRDATRKALVEATAGMTGIGCETLQALHSGTSNWISWGCRALFAICAIEGEPGYDPAAFNRFADAQINFINAMYPTGEAFEGWGKNFMFLEHMILLAKRGEDRNVLGHTSVRSAYNNYFVASMTPWGNSFTFCDSMAKSGGKIARNADVLMYHRLFPNDPAGNLIFRNQIAGDYDNVGARAINTRHPFSTMDALCCAIFATDITPGDAATEFSAVTRDRPLTYFSDDTCNLITRSGWDPDALYLNYLNRAVPGGHQYCDRSHFNLYADGRFWSIYQSSRQIKEQYMPIMRSVLLIDGMGPSTAEAQCVGFYDSPLATFIITDLRNPWNFQTTSLEKAPPGAPLLAKQRSYNSFRLRPSPLPWMAAPIGGLPHWYSSEKPAENEGASWFQRFDVRKAFRSAGLVRGQHSYALIVDDVQLDDEARDFKWGMTLPPDVVLVSSQVTSDKPGAYEADIVLGEGEKPDLASAKPSERRRFLLVRVLSAAHLEDGVVEPVTVPNRPQPDITLNRLHVTGRATNPALRVLLVPFREGDPLPATRWNADRSECTMQWTQQTDVVTFEPGDDGRTTLHVSRK